MDNCTNLLDISDIFTFVPLTRAPKLPDSVTNMHSTFLLQHNITNVYHIPNNVEDLSQTFFECQNLSTTPDLSNCANLSNMYQTF